MTNEELFKKIQSLIPALEEVVELLDQWKEERAAWAKKDALVKGLINAAENFELSLSGSDRDLLNEAIKEVEGR